MKAPKEPEKDYSAIAIQTSQHALQAHIGQLVLEVTTLRGQVAALKAELDDLKDK